METKRLALLIDGDNAQAALLPQMLAEVSKYGTLTIQRVYGDWSKPNMTSWDEVLRTYALEQIQQRSYTKGKNTTDIALIIDGMEILFTEDIDGFCIASSDGDYTLLATRIRKKKKFVLGIGKKNTPATFVDACDEFVYTEDLQVTEPQKPTPKVSKPNSYKNEASEFKSSPPISLHFIPKEGFALVKERKTGVSLPKKINSPTPLSQKNPSPKVVKDDADTRRLKTLLREAFGKAVHTDGWAHLSALGDFLQQIEPKFDSQKYGHKQLKQLVQAHPKFIEVKERKLQSGGDVTYVRLKENSQPKK